MVVVRYPLFYRGIPPPPPVLTHNHVSFASSPRQQGSHSTSTGSSRSFLDIYNRNKNHTPPGILRQPPPPSPLPEHYTPLRMTSSYHRPSGKSKMNYVRNSSDERTTTKRTPAYQSRGSSFHTSRSTREQSSNRTRRNVSNRNSARINPDPKNSISSGVSRNRTRSTTRNSSSDERRGKTNQSKSAYHHTRRAKYRGSRRF